MSKQELIVGYDLCADNSQISYYNIEKMEPDSVGTGQQQIPTVLCRRFADGQWLVGQAALDAAQTGAGVLVRGFTENIGQDPVADVAGERIEKAELLYIYIAHTLEVLDTVMPGAPIGFLTITTEKMDLAMADALRQVGSRLGLPAGKLDIQSHMLSYEYYALSQKRELWTHDVGLFEYDRKGLYYHHLSISWKYHPASVTAQTTDLSQYLDGHELAEPVAPEMDRKFLEAIKEVSARRTISTYYLVGEGFEDAGAGSSWMNVSLQQLCALRRHVFVGQNLYARGACYNSYYQAVLEKKPGFTAANADWLTKDIYIRSVHRNTPQKVMLAASGTPWYSMASEKQIILNGCEALVLHIRDRITNLERKVSLLLEGLPKRPAKATRLQILTSFQTESRCIIRVRDMGFGEIFPSSGKTWELSIDMNEAEEDADSIQEQGAVIEATIPSKTLPLDMKMSGIRIFSLEELCWYLSENVYAVTEEFFDDAMLHWMDQITGEHTLSLALSNYKAAEKPLKEIVRLLLNSVDYLNNAEIAAIYNKLTEMEKQNPVEHARLAADNYCRYGYHMAALKIYQHVVYQMEHAYSNEVTRRFKADTWHNMAVTFLKLHNLHSASVCMQKAYRTEKDLNYLKCYIRILHLMGAQDKILETVRQENIQSSLLDEILAQCRQAESAYPSSARGMRMKQGLDLKKEQKLEDYSRFVENYLEEQKRRYDLS